MPTRKQRRRREKTFRHEYEWVEFDPEAGEERPVDPSELRAEKPEKAKKAPPARGQRQRAPRRVPQPASWRRVGKRGAIFAPLMFIFVFYAVNGKSTKQTPLSALLETAILMLFFLPFSYLVDSMTYRLYQRRMSRPPAKSAEPKR